MRHLTASAVAISLILAAGSVRSETGIEAFVLAPDDHAIAILTAGPFVLELEEGGQKKGMPLPFLEEAEVPPKPRLAWSHDGRYVSIQYRFDEDTNVAAIIDVNQLKVVWQERVAWVEWIDDGHYLLAVPHYSSDEEQAVAGLIRIDPSTGEEKQVAIDRYFTGEFDAGRSVVVGHVVRKVGDRYAYSLEEVELGEPVDSP
jgi:hypothetical protein